MKSKSCLVVDDSRVVRNVARRILEHFGFSCEEAENGEQALDFCKKNMPDVILLDWKMPVMTGIEFLEALRAAKDGDKPVVVFCTTEGDRDSIEKAMKFGANEYIVKPFDREILESKFVQIGLIKPKK